ncbi:glycosyltransferase [Streptomyces lomondensis]|uniref:Glycosyl transferase family 1 n=1 Tax=Streptomyces lomondensis TaxID=68229 RepID=A0ABQ2XLD6_9ACTN|nr:glycosyltransferase [Streptomyces lomondensis]MCF0079323.1 glycosyltransferase [Streptomyces lomondensis]GGX21484.1 glycosyl transferase family 1 [Streptomyces lomondensis]
MSSVAVLVELERNGTSGGHVKCWERLAESAARLPERLPDGSGSGLDLTVYFLGERERVEVLSPRVRLVMLRPVLRTAALASADGAEDVTDLAPHHPRLAALLPRHDVWHCTHSFAYATTAVRLARRAARGSGPLPRLLASVHTDVPLLASVYARYLAGRWLPGDRPGPGAFLADRAETLLRRRRDRLLDSCERVLVPTSAGRAELGRVLGPHRVAPLRRGVDHERFRPDPGARGRLGREYGVPTDRPLVLFAGRLDATKGVPLLTASVRLLRERGRAVHLVMAGAGAEAGPVRHALGADVSLLGPLPQDRLARVYAGCDVFAFPSRTETCGNVVAEAMASGLAVVLPEGAHTAEWLSAPGRDGIVVRRDDPGEWADALAALLDHPPLLSAVRHRAAATARATHPTWDRVLTEDLLPVWLPQPPSRDRERPRAA